MYIIIDGHVDFSLDMKHNVLTLEMTSDLQLDLDKNDI
jgi:hypothetical protein